MALGLLQPAGYLAGSKVLRGLGAASASSPLPLVFTEVKGLETFASRFDLEYVDGKGHKGRLRITPHEYARLGGPYNWRNVYGAAISYGPILPEGLWRSVLRHGFCREGPLAEAMKIPDLSRATIIVSTRTRNRDDSWRLEIPCNQ